MKVTAEHVRIVGKNHKTGTNKNGDWEIFEVECNNGEGAVIAVSASKENYEKLVPFEPYTMEIDLFRKGYNLGGELLAAWEE